jgi:hypothetical protein
MFPVNDPEPGHGALPAPRCPFIGYVPPENRPCLDEVLHVDARGALEPFWSPFISSKEQLCSPISCNPKQFSRS